MASTFKADVEKWIAKSERLTMAVVQTAAQEMIKEAQLPKAQGGNMPVRDGFLRNSGGASLNQWPSGSSGTYSIESVTATLLGAKAGDTIIFAWGAEYAAYQEALNGFARLAAQNWQRHVNSAVKQVRERVK